MLCQQSATRLACSHGFQLTDAPSLYPGVSIMQMFLSKTKSPILFLRLRSRESSKSDHHSGYGFVLANISEVWLVELMFLGGWGLPRRGLER